MNASLAVTVVLMGLAGTPHCATMCGAACAGVASRCAGQRPGSALRALHLGRFVSYAVAGAVVAATAHTLALWSQELRWLKPFWGMLHLAAFSLGLYLMWTGLQPRWMAAWGQGHTRGGDAVVVAPPFGRRMPTAWRPLKGPAKAGLWGLAWAAWPCGLLQSALLVAALAPSPAEGAAVMALFAISSGAGLWLGPWLWIRLRAGGVVQGVSAQWAVRMAGALLAAASGWALVHGLWASYGSLLC